MLKKLYKRLFESKTVINNYYYKSDNKESTKQYESYINLANKYHFTFESIRNLKNKYYLLYPLIVILTIFSMYIGLDYIFSEDKSKSNDLWALIKVWLCFIPAIISFNIYLEKLDMSILENFNTAHKQNFSKITEAKKYWLKKYLSSYPNLYEASQEFTNWQSSYELKNDKVKFDFFHMIYNKDAKTRLMSLFIALFSITTLILLKASPEINIVEFCAYLKGLFPLAIISFIIIGTLMLEFVFLLKIVTKAIKNIQDFFKTKNEYSALRFNRFIVFLLENADTQNR